MIKRWFLGLAITIFSGLVCCICIMAITDFINMMSTTGKDFVLCFISFIGETIFGFFILPCAMVEFTCFIYDRW